MLKVFLYILLMIFLVGGNLVSRHYIIGKGGKLTDEDIGVIYTFGLVLGALSLYIINLISSL